MSVILPRMFVLLPPRLSARITQTGSAGSNFSRTVCLEGSKRPQTIPAEAKYDEMFLQKRKLVDLFYSPCYLPGISPCTHRGITLQQTEFIDKYFFHSSSEKIRLDISCEFAARQRIHMKNQALFFLNIKVKN